MTETAELSDHFCAVCSFTVLGAAEHSTVSLLSVLCKCKPNYVK